MELGQTVADLSRQGVDLREEVRRLSLGDDGVDLVGVAPVDRFGSLPADRRPEALLPGTRSVIVLGSQVFRVLTDRLKPSRAVGELSVRDIYEAHKETVVSALRQTGYRVARYLTNRGSRSLNLDQNLTDARTLSAVLSFKGAAVAAGLGVIGKNGLLLTPSYGPRVRLAVVLTEAEMEGDPLLTDDPCENCDICVRGCPSGALKPPADGHRVNHDRFLCSSYSGAVKGCGLCMSRCPR